MDDITGDDNYNTLKEMILDENKLVTYVSISRDLCIHVNESKRLLGLMVNHTKKTQPDVVLNVNRIMSGITEGNNAITTVCSEKDIDSVRQRLKTIFFEHIYSVSKGSPLVDNVALMSANKFEDLPLCSGLIKSSMCVKHSMDEISKFKSNSQEVTPIDKKLNNTQSKSTELKKGLNKVVNGESSNNSVKNESNDIKIKTEITSPKIDKKNSNRSTKGIAGFFNKSNGIAAKKPKNDTSTTSLSTAIKVEKEEKKVEVKKQEQPISMEVENMEVDKEEPSESKKKNTSKNTDKARNRSVTSIKKNAKVDKKRKRVLQVSDSESDDEKNDPFADSTPVNNQAFESDDEIPPTPTANTVKITSGITNPKKRRKIVDKTYTDEDGYILTKKEEVYESCSDNEVEIASKENNHVNEVKVETWTSKKPKLEVSPSKSSKVEISPSKKQNGPKNGKKKISPHQKGKQATLMNFFKKV